jgi:hypothetical protein
MRYALGAVMILFTGCGGNDAPCTDVGMPASLAARAALLRLDVFDGAVRCDGAGVVAGAPAPSMSRWAPSGQPIQLDIPAGPHTLLLSAFSDVGGTALLATACTEADLGAGASVCFNLALVEKPDASTQDAGPPPDLARPPCTPAPDDCPLGTYCASDGKCADGCKSAADCAMSPSGAHLCDTTQHRCVHCLQPNDCVAGKRCSPSGDCVDGCDVSAGSLCPGQQMCCSMLCLDTSKDISSCGACGRACSSANVATPQCSSSLCKPACTTGWGDCNQPIAPNPDDGCETNLNDVAHCGACNNACNLANATPTCPSGTCKVASCNAGYFDCNGTASDGCECAGVDKMDGMKGCCASNACQALHSDGWSHSFYDCTPFGTYSEALATAAARAYNPNGTIYTNTTACGTVSIVCNRLPGGTQSVGWAYADTAGVVIGRTSIHNSNGCSCPTTSDGTWE